MPLPDEAKSKELKDLADRYKSPRRMTWMFHMPKLTEELFLEACRAHQPALMINGQLVNLDADQIQWLKEYCERKLNLPFDWEDRAYDKVIQAWKKKGYGVEYGPCLTGELVDVKIGIKHAKKTADQGNLFG